MKHKSIAERFCLTAHVVSTLFGLAGLLFILPNPELVANLPPLGMKLFTWGMTAGGITYIVFGAATLALYGYRTLGLGTTLAFMIPSILLSLSSELLGTSTGFPFGHYQYLSGLGYKIAGLVPFTIPLSWFYMGLTCYLLARAGLKLTMGDRWGRQLAALALGAVLLTAWDLVLDPAMSQAPFPFWQFQEVGEFFGMPYRNLVGWMGTGLVFMSVGAFLWRRTPIALSRSQLTVPLIVYLTNFFFGAAITVVELDARFLLPTALSILFGVIPAFIFWWNAKPSLETMESLLPSDNINSSPVEVAVK